MPVIDLTHLPPWLQGGERIEISREADRLDAELGFHPYFRFALLLRWEPVNDISL